MITVPFVITVLITFFSPFANAFIQRVNWSPETKHLVALGVSALIAIGYLLMTGGIGDWSQLGVVIPAVYGLQQAVFAFILKVPATKFEAATTKGAVIVSPATDPGTVNITTEDSIKSGAEPITAVPPVQIEPTITEVTSTTPAKG